MVLYQTFPSRFTIGGKAQGLLKLQGLNIPVPHFLVLPAETFAPLLADSHRASDALKPKLNSFALAEADQKEIARILSTWNFPTVPVVVRSSIADEDGIENAFAGLMDSFINLKTLPQVLEAINKCVASAYSERAISYRTQKGLTKNARPAVIIQQQVAAQSSGVIFSTYPEYPQEMAIHAVWGFGEGLVSGQLQPDEFYLLKKDGSVNRKQIADKQQEIIAVAKEGTETIDVGAEKRQAACLSDDQLNQLYILASNIETALNRPQDIEFVVDEKQIWFVQSRAITQAIPQVVVYDNSNIQESYCGVTTPLTFSFAQRAYATVYKQTMKVLALPEAIVQAHEEVVNNLLGLIKGRIYYNINNWYKGLLLLPSFKQNKEDMERMMGLTDPVDFVSGTSKTFLQKLQLAPSLIINLIRLLAAFKKLPSTIQTFHHHFTTHYKTFYQLPLHQLPVHELLQQKQRLDEGLLNNWTTPIINDFYVMMTNGKVNRNLKKAGINDVQEFLSRYLSGDQEIESAQPAKVMQQLAEKVKQSGELEALIVKLGSDLHSNLKQQYHDFYNEVERFIDTYGDRTVGELKLETTTMRIEPLIFYKYLKNFVTSKNATLTNANSSLKNEAAKELQEKLNKHNSYFRKKVYKNLDKLQNAIRNREALRLERTRLFGMYRTIYLQIGKQFTVSGKLSNATDIFYLTEQEIITYTAELNTDIKAIIEDRKRQFEAYKSEDVPSRVVVPSPPIVIQESAITDPSKLNGTGCFPGTVTAETIVVTGPESDLDVSGKIVCALRTDPGWVALFPTCRGVLIEKGSALSHSVILLREFGIPTIINIPGLTKRIASGQQITMNGSTGEIQIIGNEY